MQVSATSRVGLGEAGVMLTAVFSFSVYVAGKAAKAGYPPAVSSMPGPYYIPSVPVAGVPSPAVLMDKSHPPPLAPSDATGGSQNGNLQCQAQHSVLFLGAGLRMGGASIFEQDKHRQTAF